MKTGAKVLLSTIFTFIGLPLLWFAAWCLNLWMFLKLQVMFADHLPWEPLSRGAVATILIFLYAVKGTLVGIKQNRESDESGEDGMGEKVAHFVVKTLLTPVVQIAFAYAVLWWII